MIKTSWFKATTKNFDAKVNSILNTDFFDSENLLFASVMRPIETAEIDPGLVLGIYDKYKVLNLFLAKKVSDGNISTFRLRRSLGEPKFFDDSISQGFNGYQQTVGQRFLSRRSLIPAIHDNLTKDELASRTSKLETLAKLNDAIVYQRR